MTSADISECIAKMIEDKIIKEWKHEGYIDQVCHDSVQACIDGKHYTIRLTCYEDTNEKG